MKIETKTEDKTQERKRKRSQKVQEGGAFDSRNLASSTFGHLSPTEEKEEEKEEENVKEGRKRSWKKRSKGLTFPLAPHTSWSTRSLRTAKEEPTQHDFFWFGMMGTYRPPSLH